MNYNNKISYLAEQLDIFYTIYAKVHSSEPLTANEITLLSHFKENLVSDEHRAMLKRIFYTLRLQQKRNHRPQAVCSF